MRQTLQPAIVDTIPTNSINTILKSNQDTIGDHVPDIEPLSKISTPETRKSSEVDLVESARTALISTFANQDDGSQWFYVSIALGVVVLILSIIVIVNLYKRHMRPPEARSFKGAVHSQGVKAPDDVVNQFLFDMKAKSGKLDVVQLKVKLDETTNRIFDFTGEEFQFVESQGTAPNTRDLFPTFPIYSDIEQFLTGNCYLMAALKSILNTVSCAKDIIFCVCN
jgi:hypothetical protein